MNEEGVRLRNEEDMIKAEPDLLCLAKIVRQFVSRVRSGLFEAWPRQTLSQMCMQIEYSSPYRANGLSSNLPYAGPDKLSAVAQTLAEGLVQVWCSAANGRRADRHASVSIVGVCGEACGGVGPAH